MGAGADRLLQFDTPLCGGYFFVPALKGPTGIQLASEHVMSGYVVWKFSKSQDVAKEFLVQSKIVNG